MQEITCDALAAEPSYLQQFQRHDPAWLIHGQEAVSRAVCVLDKPLQVRKLSFFLLACISHTNMPACHACMDPLLHSAGATIASMNSCWSHPLRTRLGKGHVGDIPLALYTPVGT